MLSQKHGIREIKNEQRVLKIVNHPGIIKLHTTFREGDAEYLVLDYALNGDFSEFLRQKSNSIFNGLNRFCVDIKANETRQYYISSLVSILQYLRSINYVHRDLKPANLLLNERFQLVLSDFGTATQINKPKELVTNVKRISKSFENLHKHLAVDTSDFDGDEGEIFGTRDYVPPEMLQGIKPTFGSDLWSLGIIVWQIYSLDNQTPF